jgi:hypothetical protein
MSSNWQHQYLYKVNFSVSVSFLTLDCNSITFPLIRWLLKSVIRLEAFTAVNIYIEFFWDVTQYSLVAVATSNPTHFASEDRDRTIFQNVGIHRQDYTV